MNGTWRGRFLRHIYVALQIPHLKPSDNWFMRNADEAFHQSVYRQLIG